MRMRRRQRKILLDAHCDAREHSDQQDHSTNAHHQRSAHSSFLKLLLGVANRVGERELTRGPRLCDLMSLTGLAYLFLGIEP